MGTSDGLVVPLDCHQKPGHIVPGSRAFECTAPLGSAKTIHNTSRDRRPVTVVQVTESWGAFICIVESLLTAYDLQTYELICQVQETKGCTNFSAHERSSSLVVATAKTRLAVYLWHGEAASLDASQRLPFSRLHHCDPFVHVRVRLRPAAGVVAH